MQFAAMFYNMLACESICCSFFFEVNRFDLNKLFFCTKDA